MDTLTETLAAAGGTLTVLRPVPATARASRRVPEHLRFIGEHWPGLSAAAYAGFTRHGAGAVVLFGGENPAGPVLRRRGSGRPFEPQRLFYATTLLGLPGPPPADWTATWEARRMDTYDPETEGLVVFVEGEAPPRGYLVSGSPAPRAAYLGAQAMLN